MYSSFVVVGVYHDIVILSSLGRVRHVGRVNSDFRNENVSQHSRLMKNKTMAKMNNERNKKPLKRNTNERQRWIEQQIW